MCLETYRKTMSKKVETSETQQATFMDELLKNGTTILTAKSPEDLAEMVNGIPSDVKYGAGAAGRNKETGAWTLRIDLLKD